MYHKEPTYIRKGKVITMVGTSEREELKTISQAKRRSREIQQQSPPMGNGYLRVQSFS